MLRLYRKFCLMLKITINKRFGKKLKEADIKGYRTILRMLYHPSANTPLKDPDTLKYYISVPRQDLDLIIDMDKAEITNTSRIYEINVDKIILSRALIKIENEVRRQRNQLERDIRARKENTHDIIARKVRWR